GFFSYELFSRTLFYRYIIAPVLIPSLLRLPWDHRSREKAISQMKLSYKSHYERSYLKMYCSMVTFGLLIPKCHYGKRGTLMTRRRFVVPTTDRKCSIYYRGKRNGIFYPEMLGFGSAKWA